MEILLTGASGFVGSLLLDALRRDSHDVRALTRRPERLDASPARVMRGDAVTGEGLEPALRGVEVAYYLIHSMEPLAGSGHASAASVSRSGGSGHASAASVSRSGGSGHASAASFVERERIAAENFAAAARAAGVRRIVYLGGLVPRWGPATGEELTRAARTRRSRHLQSREAVERILLDAVPDSLALRASIVIGARSRSFRLLVRLVERMPVLALPAWQRYRTQPIDARDMIAMLAACARSELSGEVLEVGGPDVLSYGEMIERIADAMLVGRPSLRLRVNMTPLAGRLAAAIASESPELVVPLMEGLQGDLLARDDRAAERLGVRLHSFDSAVEHALAEWERAEPLAAR